MPWDLRQGIPGGWGGHPVDDPGSGMTPKTCCQRAICGAKNFFKAPIYLKLWKNFLATVKDQ